MSTLLATLGGVLGIIAAVTAALLFEDHIHTRRRDRCTCTTCLQWRAEAGDLDADLQLLILQETP